MYIGTNHKKSNYIYLIYLRIYDNILRLTPCIVGNIRCFAIHRVQDLISLYHLMFCSYMHTNVRKKLVSIIYVIGSISAGKSSLTEILAKDLNSTPYYEDVNNGLIKGMLEHFYSAGAESRKQVSAMLQVAFLTVRYQQLKKAIVEENAVLDSNLASDYILARNIYERGEMDEDAYNVYMTLNQEMQSNVNGSPFNGFPDLVIYIDIDEEAEIDSIQSRGREMEDVRKDPKLVDYYHSVNRAYKRWYNGFYQAPVVRIDRSQYDFVNNLSDRNEVLNLIEQKLVDLGKLTQDEFDKIKAKRDKEV